MKRQACACALVSVLTLATTQMCFGAKSDVVQEKIAEAHRLVTGYYGDSRVLTRAAALIAAVLQEHPDSSDAYVEAARITVKGGHIVSNRFEPGTQSSYRALIDKALELNPMNVRAISLKSESSMMAGDIEEGLAWAKRGLSIDPDFPWLKLRIADYYRKKNDASRALGVLREIDSGPCEKDDDYRAACVSALTQQVRYFSVPGNTDVLNHFAARIEKLRNPRNAWVLGDLSYAYIQVGDYDKAILLGRKALNIMNYGVGRLNLAMALYIKASKDSASGNDSSPAMKEAKSLGVGAESVIEWFRTAGKEPQKHRARVMAMLDVPDSN